MSYLELVEEFPRDPEISQFEKILVAARRAKDLHEEDLIPMVELHLTEPYIALQELREGKIKVTYREETSVELIGEDSEEPDEEE